MAQTVVVATQHKETVIHLNMYSKKNENDGREEKKSRWGQTSQWSLDSCCELVNAHWQGICENLCETP